MANRKDNNQKAIKRVGVTRKMSESNKVQKLKSSKKYAQGREYNTLEGRIKIINRYLENGEIMIAYLNIKTDEIIVKGELDVNSMLYNYTKEIAKKAQPKTIEAPKVKPLDGEAEALRLQARALEEEVRNLKGLIETLKAENESKQGVIDKQFDLISALMGQNKRG